MKLLVIEDEHRIAASIKKGLEQERYIVDVAYTGDDGYDMAYTGDYDLIILDILLPAINGIEIVKQLRKESIHTPILMLTAKDQVADKVRGLNSGADDYLSKPFSFEELLARARALLRRPKETLGTILIAADLQLDATTYQVKRNNTLIPLSNKEYTLLAYLLRHAGKVCTKEQIMNHVWDYNADILPNTVEVYIRNLRNKIDKPFKNSKSLIQTIRGFGYKIG
ncbi:response regulator transcription factor [Candidatus Roizmanbacteria bacterium]|nr:response regulator transcription factor [Candidatus Roizmanbacteria bacterium]